MSNRLMNRDHLRLKMDEKKIPPHMHDGLIRYIVDGIPPGDFLTAVINNDLREAVGRADLLNRAALADYVMFFYNDAPSGCWGRPDAMETWCKTIATIAELKREDAS
jgi:hypothetical protein